eukprot:TRINITY_DN1769_c1_g1_i1.p3 TRINITY_DN1769_c1_g1~~TRINITY_DN1769_c1_g1_i1.p3  ORF type:complete len:119 (-),score=27.33 TRINITY_DN1769_c1_g1_i1:214-570(-)
MAGMMCQRLCKKQAPKTAALLQFRILLLTANPGQIHHTSDEEVAYVEKVKHSTAKLLTAAVQSSSKEDTWEPLLQKLKESASVQKAASYSGQSMMRFMHGVLQDIACDMDGGVFESGG